MRVQTLINNEVLKPCPFCGKEVTLISTSRTKQFIFSHQGLRNCPFYQFEMSWECATSLKEAKEIWNRRAESKTIINNGTMNISL